jgi:prolyl oligopeptidase
MARRFAVTRQELPTHAGRWWFELALPEEGGQDVLRVSEKLGETGRVLIDPSALSTEVPITLDWHYPSPDGRYVAYGLSTRGSEESTLHVIETETGTVLPERIPHTAFAVVAWLPDSSGFYYTGCEGDVVHHPWQRLYFHILGDVSIPQPEPVEFENMLVRPQVSPDGRYLATLTGRPETRPTHIKDLRTGEWNEFLLRVRGSCEGIFDTHRYLAIDRHEHSHGRLVSIPIATAADKSTWTEIIPETDVVLRGVARVGEKIVLTELVDVVSRIRVYNLTGELEGEIPLPEAGMVATHQMLYAPMDGSGVVGAPGNPEMLFLFQSLRQSPSVIRFNVDTWQQDVLIPPGKVHQDLAIRQLFATSPDGTSVPVFLLHRSDLDLARPHPTVVHAYGGFGLCLLPGYHSSFIDVTEAGGIFALVNPRGGAEYGLQWWLDGRRERKQNTFTDVYAAVDMLITRGFTTNDQVAFTGASNGGMLSGVMATQRPEVFRAVVPLVPACDLMHSGRDPWTLDVIGPEYGDPRIPREARWVFAYSPYHTVHEGVTYPAILAFSGGSDIRCAPWHSRKLAAKLQQDNRSPHPTLVRVYPDVGHNSGLSRPQQAEYTAEWTGFLMREIGLTPAP